MTDVSSGIGAGAGSGHIPHQAEVSGKESVDGNLQAGEAASAKETTPVTARGFTAENTVSHEGRNPLDAPVGTGKVRLPVPERNLSDVTPDIQEELDNAAAGLNMFSMDSIFDQDGDGVSALDEFIAAAEAGDPRDFPTFLAEEGLEGLNVEQLIEFEETASDVFIHMSNIESAPPEVMAELKGMMNDAERALASGNIEDVAAILSRIQTKLRDSRIKFDQESLNAAKLAREQKSAERGDKLVEALKKME